MDEIEFKGKRVDNGEWVAGDLLQDFHGPYINPASVLSTEMNADFIEVDPKTVGQYSQLKDKYRKKIYQGDTDSNAYVVIFESGCFWLRDPISTFVVDLLFNLNSDTEITGNIHDKQEGK